MVEIPPTTSTTSENEPNSSFYNDSTYLDLLKMDAIASQFGRGLVDLAELVESRAITSTENLITERLTQQSKVLEEQARALQSGLQQQIQEAHAGQESKQRQEREGAERDLLQQVSTRLQESQQDALAALEARLQEAQQTTLLALDKSLEFREAKISGNLDVRLQKFEDLIVARLEETAKQEQKNLLAKVDARLDEWAQSLGGTLTQRVSVEISQEVDGQMAQIKTDIAEKAAAIERTKEFLKKESALVVEGVCMKLEEVEGTVQRLSAEQQDQKIDADALGKIKGEILASTSSEVQKMSSLLGLEFQQNLGKVKSTIEEGIETDIAMQKNRVDALERLVKEVSASPLPSASSGNEPSAQRGGSVQDAKALVESALAVQSAKSALQSEGARMNARLVEISEKETRLSKEVDALRVEMRTLQKQSEEMGRTVGDLQSLGKQTMKALQDYQGPPGPASAQGGPIDQLALSTNGAVVSTTPVFPVRVPAQHQSSGTANVTPGIQRIVQTTTFTSTSSTADAFSSDAFPGLQHLDPYAGTRLSDADYLRHIYKSLDVSTNGTNTIPALEMPNYEEVGPTGSRSVAGNGAVSSSSAAAVTGPGVVGGGATISSASTSPSVGTTTNVGTSSNSKPNANYSVGGATSTGSGTAIARPGSGTVLSKGTQQITSAVGGQLPGARIGMPPPTVVLHRGPGEAASSPQASPQQYTRNTPSDQLYGGGGPATGVAAFNYAAPYTTTTQPPTGSGIAVVSPVNPALVAGARTESAAAVVSPGPKGRGGDQDQGCGVQ